MKRITKKALFLILVMTIVIGASLGTYAACKKTVRYSKNRGTTAASIRVINKVATKVPRGTTNLTFNDSGYLKFTAPKTATYSFTFSNVRGKNVCSGVSIYKYVPSQKSWTGRTFAAHLEAIKVSTQGGKAYSLNLASKGKTIPGNKSTTGANKYLASRTGKIRLSKGQTIYMYYFASYKCKNTATLVIR
jgi:hypothetical protein